MQYIGKVRHQVQVQFIWFHLITFYNKNRKNINVKSDMWMPPKMQRVRRLMKIRNLCAEEVDEDQKSVMCQKCNRSNSVTFDTSVMCQKCNRWTHQSCANLNNQEMKALEKGRHNIMWFCNACTAEVVKLIERYTNPKL